MSTRYPYSFDRVADIYDATRGWPPGVGEQIGAELYKLLAPLAGRGPLRVLEIGAGTGRVLVPLAAAGAWAVGVDISPGMLRLLQDKWPPAGAAGRLEPILADAHHLPFPDARFDAGLFVHILHLLEDWPIVLAEVQRVVRPGGALAFGGDHEPGEEHWIGPRWEELVAAAGGVAAEGRRHAAAEEAMADLRAQGYDIQEHVLARWTATRTPADILQRYQGRSNSASWAIPDAVLDAAVAQLQTELLARYGSLDAPIPRERWFRVFLARRA